MAKQGSPGNELKKGPWRQAPSTEARSSHPATDCCLACGRARRTAALRAPAPGECVLLRLAHWLRMALAALEFCAMASGLQGLHVLGLSRRVRTDEGSTAPPVTPSNGTQC